MWDEMEMVLNELRLSKKNLIFPKATEISEKMTECWYSKI